MAKTVADKALEYARDYELTPMKDTAIRGFIAGHFSAMKMPLKERLSEEDKTMLRQKYQEVKGRWLKEGNQKQEALYFGKMQMLTELFGKDMFYDK